MYRSKYLRSFATSARSSAIFNSLPTGGVRLDGVVAGRSLCMMQVYKAQKLLPPLPEGRNRTKLWLFDRLSC